MLTAIAAFAEAFANPLAAPLVLCLALLLARPMQLRVACAGLGFMLELPNLALAAPPGAIALGVLGAVAALLLYAELALHFVLPSLRFARRCIVTAWELVGLAAAMLLGLRRHRAPGSASAAEPDKPLPSPPEELP